MGNKGIPDSESLSDLYRFSEEVTFTPVSETASNLGPVCPPNYSDRGTFGGKYRLCLLCSRDYRMIDKPSQTSVSLSEKIPKTFRIKDKQQLFGTLQTNPATQ